MTPPFLTSFLKNTRGNLSITTALAGTLLLTAVGASMDGGRMITTKMQLQSITDAAALMAATPENMSVQQRRELAYESIRTHLDRRGDLELTQQDVFIRRAGDEVEVEIAAEVPLLFGAFLGGSNRSVRVSSTAEEVETSSLNAISISVILDLSDSMGERFDVGTKISNVRMALNEFLGSTQAQLGESQMSSGIYSFNWGDVPSETVALVPGASNVVDVLTYLPLSEGSVPTTAMEAALADQLSERDQVGDRDRFIVFITDGDVDDEKSDQRGRYLSDTSMLSDESRPECAGAIRRLAETEEKLAHHYNNIRQHLSNSPLPLSVSASSGNVLQAANQLLDLHEDGRGSGDDDDCDEDDSCSGDGPGVQRIRRWVDKNAIAQARIDEYCVFEQTERVMDVCESVRDDESVSLLAIDLSGGDEATRELTQTCTGTFVDEADESSGERESRSRGTLSRSGESSRTDREGPEILRSENGKAVYASVSNLNELREVLATMIPEATTGERTVRLVR